MHTEALEYIHRVKRTYPAYFRDSRVLEIGSRNVNGSPRPMFTNCKYTGIDLTEGRDVDLVESALEHKARGLHYNTIVCMEALEHDRDWEKTLAAMRYMLDDYGLLVITAAGPQRPEHGTIQCSPEDSPATLDYYGNITKEMIYSVYSYDDWILQECIYGRNEQDIYFYGIIR